MKKDKNTYVTKTLIENDGLSELDFELARHFKHDYDGDGWVVEIDGKPKCNDNWYTDTTAIHVDDLLNLVKKFKKKGATHIQMEHHVDHIGYDFSALSIKLSTPQEIMAHKVHEEVRSMKLKKIKKLQKEIEKVKKS